jgi:methionyl-tRNA formyltransferase
MNIINIGYFADGAWSHLAFEQIIMDKTINIKFIVPRNDTKDDTLKKFSQKYNIDYLYPVKINSEEFLKSIDSYNCDLFVSMSFNQIFRKKIINVPHLGVINCHAGKLPFYRGRNVLNWALINDEKEFGITVHYVDEGIDTGDIILQRCFKITDKDDYNSLLKLAYSECSSILYDSIKHIQKGEFKVVKQNTIDEVGFYCGRRGPGDEIIDWNNSSRRIFNFIRAICKPGPMATTYFNNNIIRINKSRIIKNTTTYIGTNGQLLLKTKEGFIVKTNDSFIEILEIETKLKLKVGDKLGHEK